MVTPLPGTFGTGSFEDGLTSRQPTGVLGRLGHFVAPDGPSGSFTADPRSVGHRTYAPPPGLAPTLVDDGPAGGDVAPARELPVASGALGLRTAPSVPTAQTLRHAPAVPAVQRAVEAASTPSSAADADPESLAAAAASMPASAPAASATVAPEVQAEAPPAPPTTMPMAPTLAPTAPVPRRFGLGAPLPPGTAGVPGASSGPTGSSTGRSGTAGPARPPSPRAAATIQHRLEAAGEPEGAPVPTAAAEPSPPSIVGPLGAEPVASAPLVGDRPLTVPGSESLATPGPPGPRPPDATPDASEASSATGRPLSPTTGTSGFPALPTVAAKPVQRQASSLVTAPDPFAAPPPGFLRGDPSAPVTPLRVAPLATERPLLSPSVPSRVEEAAAAHPSPAPAQEPTTSARYPHRPEPSPAVQRSQDQGASRADGGWVDAGAVAVAAGLAHRSPDGSVVFGPPSSPPTPAADQARSIPRPAPTSPAFVQRAPDDAPTSDAGQPVSVPGEAAEPPASPTTAAPTTPAATTEGAAGAGAAGPGGGPAAMTDREVDRLARRLYPRLRDHLRGELRLDRERLGRATDLGSRN